jgi:hypothetical protein
MTASTELSLCLGSASSTNSLSFPSLSSASSDLVEESLTKLQITLLSSELSKVLNPMDLSAFVPALKQNATASFHVEGEASDLQLLHTSFLLAGLKGASEAKQADGSRVLTASKNLTSGVQTVKIKIAQLSDDIVDEDGLLSDASNLLGAPPAMSEKSKDADDCGGRAPCDDCTCGRADPKKTTENQPVKSSACGKCNLGDAFRCASCPYLGKPAFKAGNEHLVLDLQDDF